MEQKKLRRFLFFGIVFIIIAYLIPLEVHNIHDSALVLYILCFIFLSINLFIWILWGIFSRKKPSTMYVVIGVLFASLLYSFGLSIYGRVTILNDPEWFQHVHSTNLWAYRVFPLLLVCIWLVCWVISRIFGKEEIEKEMSDKSLKILIIEDEPDVRIVLRSAINSLNLFDTDCAANKNEAISYFSPNKYSLILIDLVLDKDIGNKDGIELAERFRSQDSNAYIVIISGYLDLALDDKLTSVIDDFVEKPFSIEFLKEKVFLWTIKYRRRLRIKEYIDESDFHLKKELIQTIDEKLKNFIKRKKLK